VPAVEAGAELVPKEGVLDGVRVTAPDAKNVVNITAVVGKLVGELIQQDFFVGAKAKSSIAGSRWAHGGPVELSPLSVAKLEDIFGHYHLNGCGEGMKWDGRELTRTRFDVGVNSSDGGSRVDIRVHRGGVSGEEAMTARGEHKGVELGAQVKGAPKVASESDSGLFEVVVYPDTKAVEVSAGV
jgi:hypothetical protein